MEDTQKHYTRGEINNARQSSSKGLIIRQKEPKNLETPFDQIDSHRWCGQKSVCSELRGVASYAV
jgi:hypothetical protein